MLLWRLVTFIICHFCLVYTSANKTELYCLCVLVVAIYLYEVKEQYYYGICIFCALLSRHLQLCFYKFVCHQELHYVREKETGTSVEETGKMRSYTWGMSFLAGLLWTVTYKTAISAFSFYPFWNSLSCLLIFIDLCWLTGVLYLFVFTSVTCSFMDIFKRPVIRPWFHWNKSQNSHQLQLNLSFCSFSWIFTMPASVVRMVTETSHPINSGPWFLLYHDLCLMVSAVNKFIKMFSFLSCFF